MSNIDSPPLHSSFINNVIFVICGTWSPSNKIFHHLASQYSDISFTPVDVCDACAFAKQKRLTFFINHTKTISFFQLIHVDILGLISTTSIDGYQYFLTIVDDYNCFTWILLLKHKNDVKNML